MSEAGSSEEDAEASATASSWVSGLMKNDPDTADEVYSLSDLVDGQVRDASRRILGPLCILLAPVRPFIE
jgi:hypothetical protein